MLRSVANIQEEESDDSSIKERKSKDTIETDEPEPKKKKGIIDPLSGRKQIMRSVANIQEEDSYDSSMKERKSEDTTEADERL